MIDNDAFDQPIDLPWYDVSSSNDDEVKKSTTEREKNHPSNSFPLLVQSDQTQPPLSLSLKNSDLWWQIKNPKILIG